MQSPEAVGDVEAVRRRVRDRGASVAEPVELRARVRELAELVLPANEPVRRDGNDGELHLAVSLYPEPEQGERSLVLDEIEKALLELMDEAPDTTSLLRERTFARAVH